MQEGVGLAACCLMSWIEGDLDSSFFNVSVGRMPLLEWLALGAVLCLGEVGALFISLCGVL